MSFSRNSRPKRRSDAVVDHHYRDRVHEGVGCFPAKRKRLSFPSSGWGFCGGDPYAPLNAACVGVDFVGVNGLVGVDGLANSNGNWVFSTQISTALMPRCNASSNPLPDAKCSNGQLKLEEEEDPAFMSRDEIERRSPSRRDGIDVTRETRLRYSYCAFLQNLGLRLELPQTTIGTAMVLCHRFFVRRSHACHDRFLVATATLFLAAKSEETPRPLNNVLTASCEICHQQNLSFLPQFLPLDWFEQYRERVLEAEHMILTTLNFELNVQHPYTPLISALKKLGQSQTALVNVAWSLVSEGIVPICARLGDIVAWGMMCCSCKAFFLTPKVEKLVCSGNIQTLETYFNIMYHGFSFLLVKNKFPKQISKAFREYGSAIVIDMCICPKTYMLRSSLWLQFKPQHIAAGAAFLAARFLNFDLAFYPNILQEFQTTTKILQDVVQQLMELLL